MLRKRTRSNQKVQQMDHLVVPDCTLTSESNLHSDSLSQKHKSNSFFTAPGLFVGFNPRNPESDSVRSPTSPLDFRIFSNLGNPLRCLKVGCQKVGCLKSWECGKVGLSIVDSLEVETEQSGNVIRSCDCNKTLMLEQPPKSQPKDVAVLPNSGTRAAKVLSGTGEAPFGPESGEKFRACSLDSMGRPTNFGSRKSRLGSGVLVPENSSKPVEPKFLGGSLKIGHLFEENFCLVPPSASNFTDAATGSETDLSEYYTCVTTHGPNPKVTHIFGDRVLEGQKDEVTCIPNDNSCENAIPLGSTASEVLDSFLTSNFLKFCYSCKKDLDGEDIYMYSEKAFCSHNCRSCEIDIDEEMEKRNKSSPKISDKSSNSQEISKSILFIGMPEL